VKVRTLAAGSLEVFYGQAQALHGATLVAQCPGITCLMGRNGVGKTTMLRAIMGLQRAERGSVHLDDLDVSGLAPHARASLGIRLVPQDQVVFPGLTVKEHLELARVSRARGAQDSIEQWLGYFPVLRERMSQRADTLSGGERKMLAISQALSGGAQFLLMDEPTEGIQPSLVELIARSLVDIGKSVGIVLVEQNLDVVSYVGGAGYIMEKGAMAASGSVEELERAGLIDRYLGL
jgi:ABC-type branched-subunit amino acid transport system ATPase component